MKPNLHDDFGVRSYYSAAENNLGFVRLADYVSRCQHSEIEAHANEFDRSDPVIIKISDPIVLENAAKIVGAGGGGHHDTIGGVALPPGSDCGVALMWDGPADPPCMVKVAPVSDPLNKVMVGAEFSGFGFFGMDLAPGLLIQSNKRGHFERNYFNNCRDFGIETGVVAALGEARDCQDNDIGFAFTQYSANAGVGWRATGDEYANTCRNRVTIGLSGVMNATGVEMVVSDHNRINGELWRHPSGLARCVVLHGGPTTALRSRWEKFHELATGNDTIQVCGTDMYAVASTDHVIEEFDFGNPHVFPIVGPGASLTIRNLKCAFAAGKNAGSFSSTTFVDVAGWAASYNHGSWFNATTGVFTAPLPGVYRFKLSLTHQATITPGSRWQFQFTRNGVGTQRGRSYSPLGAIVDSAEMVAEFALVQGETIKPQIRRVGGTGNFDVLADLSLTRFEGGIVR